MSTKLQYRLLQIVLLSIFLSLGCAHKLATTKQEASTEAQLNQKWQTSAASEQIPSASGIEEESGNDFTDDELDLFDDEFEEDTVHVADPLALWNRAMFHFNDKFYFWVLKPVARGYRVVVPSPVRIGVKNFFTNITTPIRMVNCILQWKWQAANAEFARFLINSTVGVLGFGDPAKRFPKLNPSEEDLGQTLGAYGIGNGFYVVWPFLGPSTLRDSAGLAGDLFLNPIFYVEPIEAAVGIASYKTVNDTSLKIGDYESLKEAAINPYEALRDAYIQHRTSKVKNR